MTKEKPKFPITVKYKNEPSETFESEKDLCLNLEWFDSGDPEWEAEVLDSLGRSVELVIEKLEIKKFRLTEKC